MDSLKIQYHVNCSFLIHTEQTRILMDGLFQASLFFSDMSLSLKTALYKQFPPYDRIDHLVFTHGHPDHFSPDETIAYIKRHPVKSIILPFESGEPADSLSRLHRCLPENTDMICPRCSMLETCPPYDLGDIRLTYLHTPHIEAPFMPAYNYSLFLETGSLCIFFSADSDFPTDPYLDIIKRKNPDYGFFNPFFLLHKKGNDILQKLNLKHSFILNYS